MGNGLDARDLRVSAAVAALTVRPEGRRFGPRATSSALLASLPSDVYVGRPSYHLERNEWLLYAFDPSERAVVGVRRSGSTAITATEIGVVQEWQGEWSSASRPRALLASSASHRRRDWCARPVVDPMTAGGRVRRAQRGSMDSLAPVMHIYQCDVLPATRTAARRARVRARQAVPQGSLPVDMPEDSKGCGHSEPSY